MWFLIFYNWTPAPVTFRPSFNLLPEVLNFCSRTTWETSPLHQDCYRLLTWDFTCFFFSSLSLFLLCATRWNDLYECSSVPLNVDENIVSLLRKIPPFFFFSINIHARDQRKKSLEEDGINSSLFLSRLKSNIFFFFFLKEKANIIHLSCLEKFIIKPCFKTVRDDE